MDQPLYSNLGFEQALEVRQSATFPIELQVTDADDAPYDLTGCEVRASIVKISDPTSKVDFTFDAGGADGVATGSVSAADTTTLTPNDKRMSVALYRWSCDIKLADGSTIIPFCHGEVLVRSRTLTGANCYGRTHRRTRPA